MCGIAGIFRYDSSSVLEQDVAQAQGMINTIVHRGPDGHGVKSAGSVVLGHCRLSIIDLGGGVQPMQTPDGKVILSYNGEVYNYIELRNELQQAGYTFQTSSDTEVVLVSYLHWGENCFEHFNGMWAIAIADTRRETRLICSRDRMGIKPLYFKRQKDAFVFASEIKALHAGELSCAAVDLQIVWDYLVFGPMPYGQTHIKEVQEVEAGTTIVVEQSGKFSVRPYFSLEKTFEQQARTYNTQKIKELLDDAITLRLRADVPVATINSGGLDSSYISAISQQHRHGLHTFCVAPTNGTTPVAHKKLHGDESYYAQILAKAIGSQHITVRYDQQRFTEYIDAIVHANDGLVFHSNTIPMFLLFETIKSHNIKVVLGGEGADEVFGGYYSNRLYHMNALLGKNIGEKIIYFKYKNKRYLKDIEPHILRVVPLLRLAGFSPQLADRILGIRGAIHPQRLELLARANRLPSDRALSYYEQKTYLQSLLHRADRASMASGVELRVPFIDHRLVEHMNTITLRQKCGIRAQKEKRILKSIAAQVVPKVVIQRKKYGFGSPLQMYVPHLKKRIQLSLDDTTVSAQQWWLLNSVFPRSVMSSLLGAV